MPLFEVAIIEKPTKTEAENGATEKLVFGPKAVLAQNDQTAAINAVIGNDFPAGVNRERIEVLVRPFA